MNGKARGGTGRSQTGGRSGGSAERGRRPLRSLVAVGVVVVVFAWAYGPVILDLWRVWWGDDNYSSGLLVPLVSAYIVVSRRRQLAALPVRACYWGLALVALAVGMRFAGEVFMYGSAERLSLVVAVGGVVLTVFGKTVTRRLIWILVFLLLMVPLPRRVHEAVSLPLQSGATSSAVFLLEVLGRGVVREGNVLHVDGATVAVAEACSGLRLLTAFLVVGGAVALLTRRAAWQKAVLLASCVPIAVLCNTLRITATAIAFSQGYGPRVNQIFHDFGGYAMMPLALGILFTELWLMKALLRPVPVEAGDAPAA